MRAVPSRCLYVGRSSIVHLRFDRLFAPLSVAGCKRLRSPTRVRIKAGKRAWSSSSCIKLLCVLVVSGQNRGSIWRMMMARSSSTAAMMVVVVISCTSSGIQMLIVVVPVWVTLIAVPVLLVSTAGCSVFSPWQLVFQNESAGQEKTTRSNKTQILCSNLCRTSVDFNVLQLNNGCSCVLVGIHSIIDKV